MNTHQENHILKNKQTRQQLERDTHKKSEAHTTHKNLSQGSSVKCDGAENDQIRDIYTSV